MKTPDTRAMPEIRPRPTLPAAGRILAAVDLPSADLTPAHLEHFFFAGPPDSPTGLVGLELLGDAALLRSLAVLPAARETGLGSALVAEAEAHARLRGARAIYLLTTTAEAFFAQRGYALTERDRAPDAIRATREFAGLCPASAAFMSKRLDLDPRVCSVLFICTGNSARSIVAEQLLNHLGAGRYRGFSAGSHPRGRVHPLALDLLRDLGLPTDGLRSKSWDEFAAPGAPPLDLVVTVCDQAASEPCPLWPGQAAMEHWSIADPTTVTGPETEQRAAFRQLHRDLEARILALVRA